MVQHLNVASQKFWKPFVVPCMGNTKADALQDDTIRTIRYGMVCFSDCKMSYIPECPKNLIDIQARVYIGLLRIAYDCFVSLTVEIWVLPLQWQSLRGL